MKKDTAELQCNNKCSAQCAEKRELRGTQVVFGVNKIKGNYICYVPGGRQNKAHHSKF